MKSKNTKPKIQGTVFLDAIEHLETEWFSCFAITKALGLYCCESPKERTIYEELFNLVNERVFDDEGQRIIALQLAYGVLNGKSYKYLKNPKK